jgi:hypothetical protein
MFQPWDGKDAMLLVSKLEWPWRGLAHALRIVRTKMFKRQTTVWRDSLKGGSMNSFNNQKGAIGWILLWLLGIPVPILLLFFIVRGCT